MKIVICTERYLPSVGGVEIHTAVLAQALVELEHNVTVYTFEKLRPIQQPDNSYVVIYHHSFLEQLNIFKDADLIISNGELSLKSVLPAYLLRKKTICIYHMALPYIRLQHGGKFQLIQNKLRKVLSIFIVKHIGVTEAVIAALNLPDHLSTGVLYNPVRKNFVEGIEKQLLKQPDIGSYTYDLIYVGRIIEGKGILDLASALQVLNKRKRKIDILLVGDGHEKNEFLEYTKSLEYITVKFMPFSDPVTLALAYLSSKILLLPSASHKEGFGLVLAEFFFTGRPVLISDQAAMKEVVGNAACIVSQSNPEDLANGIEKILYNNDYYNQLKENVKIRKDLFTYERFKDNVNILMKSLR